MRLAAYGSAWLTGLIRGERGQDLIEYSLLAGFIALGHGCHGVRCGSSNRGSGEHAYRYWKLRRLECELLRPVLGLALNARKFLRGKCFSPKAKALANGEGPDSPYLGGR